ncbi:hypothetical protein CIK05_00885 [Bdellovibrio sp. qaytius]|nr:hypothetical protein CIK05_00885 [Bdellovibrio sp. qaytius]
MKKSILLLSALVVSTTFIVNCQKAPDKRRVRPSGGSGAQSDVVTDKTKTPTKACSAEVVSSYESFKSNYAKVTVKPFVKMSDEEKNAAKPFIVEANDNCNKLFDALTAAGESEGFGCISKTDKKIITKAAVKEGCYYMGSSLKALSDNADNQMTNSQKQDAKLNDDAKKVADLLIGKPLAMSKEGRMLVSETNIDGAMFLVNGEIKTSDAELKSALAASQTVCTFLEGMNIDANKETTLKIIRAESAKVTELSDSSLKSYFTEKSTMLSTAIMQEGEESPDTKRLLCLNLDPATLSVEKITKALGKEIAFASVQVATEQTDDSSAAVSTSSTVSTSAAVSTSGAVVVSSPVIALPEVVEEQAAVAASATATVVSTPAAAAETVSAPVAVEQVDQAQVEIARLKTKSEGLDAEATTAEATLKNLVDLKAKGSDIDDARNVAERIREMANSAKAEYETAAAKAAVAVQ